MNRKRAVVGVIVFLLLVGAITYYIIRKPVYDFEKFGDTSLTSITLDLSQGTGSYSANGKTQTLRVYSITPPSLNQVAQSSGTSSLVVARVAGGPLGFVPAVVQFNSSTISVWWPNVTRLVNLLSAPYTGPGTYTGSGNNTNTTLIIGEDFPCLNGNLNIDLTNPDSPNVNYITSCGYRSSFSESSGTVNSSLSSGTEVIGSFTPSTSGNLSNVSVNYSNNSIQVTTESSGVTENWLSSTYTGPGNYSSKILGTSISLILGPEFPDPVCIGQSDGYVCGTTKYGGGADFINVEKVCINNKCTDCTQNTSTLCRQALQTSCKNDKVACDNQPCTGQDPEDCANERQSCVQLGEGLYNHFNITC